MQGVLNYSINSNGYIKEIVKYWIHILLSLYIDWLFKYLKLLDFETLIILI